MTQFINSKEALVVEAIDGLLRGSGGRLARLDGYPHIKVVLRTDWDRSKVAIVSGGGAMLANSNGVPWNGSYIVASGNLLADFRSNAAVESQGRLQTARLFHMTDDPGVKDMLRFNLARDTYHQNLWLAAIDELKADGLEDTIAPDDLLDEEHTEHATSLWHLSDGPDADKGRWAHGTAPDGKHEMGFLVDPQPLGDKQSGPPPDPKLYATYDGALGEPSKPAFGTEKGVMGKIKDAVDPDPTG
mgnify:CR=1 FL=1